MFLKNLMRIAVLAASVSLTSISTTYAGVFAGGAFSANVYYFDTTTGANSIFNTLPSMGTAAIAVNPTTGVGFASSTALTGGTDQVYYFSATTANSAVSVLNTATVIGGFFTPSGLAVNGNSGSLYVLHANALGAQVVSQFDSSLNYVNTSGNVSGGGGLAWRNVGGANGSLLVSGGFNGAFGAAPSISELNLTSGVVSVFNADPISTIQNGLAIDGAGRVYMGTIGAPMLTAEGNNVYRFTSTGTNTEGAPGTPWVTVSQPGTIPAPAGPTSSTFSSPAGVLVDTDGSIIVGVQGRANPLTEMEQNGALLRYDPTGTLQQTYVTNFTPLNALALAPAAVPEPTSIALLSVAAIYGVRRISQRKIALV